MGCLNIDIRFWAWYAFPLSFDDDDGAPVLTPFLGLQ